MTLPGTTIEVLTLKEAAKVSPYSPDYLNLLVRKGKIRGRKIGRDWLVTKQELYVYLKRQHEESRSRVHELSKFVKKLDKE
ncbi:MAG: helix-turn-helix domain-containing protein [Candidatus Doudnabacteria bacterium]|nr:helix-turn-helix domain-containing protein [Candidatus Doudnabacteria bacterium]